MVKFKLPDSCSDTSLSPQREKITFQGLPKTPAPAPLSSITSWESVFETDDEDDSGYYSPPAGELSFHRRDITPLKKTESLLTLALKRQRQRKAAPAREFSYIQKFVDEQHQVDIQPSVESANYNDDDNEVASTDGGAAFYAELVAHAGLKQQSFDQAPLLVRLATDLAVGIKRSIAFITTCFGQKQQESEQSQTQQQPQPLTGEQEPLLGGKQKHQQATTTITISSTSTSFYSYVPAKPISIIAREDTHHPYHPFPRTSRIRSINCNEDEDEEDYHRLMQKQQHKQHNEMIPPNTAWVNDQCQIARAGPLGLAGEDEDEMSAYLARDADWVCCECSGVNSRWEFLCSYCGAHSKKAGCCQAAVKEVDGRLGF
ncbi:uncharacterized protein B0T15DRAFT_571455 [Chaetomium strumarium]|uniref:RanBP2-type domain-containing protein n=1 Tax=Chaetomium strumarium TaxID=1170767 RepID=A0AAJ0M6S2_9PEZI|nr:hypothetical protein B0T15DRAFT_571455 [Chaetomium strumarium]